jgi:predicted acetyltransferase
MDVEIRPVTDDELPNFVTVEHVAFGQVATSDRIDAVREIAELDRTLAAFDDGRIVGTAAAGSWELTVPGPTTVPAATVTAVTVLPTHRRRGILTALMARQLDDVADRGEAVAVLNASEGIIYGRFGYGVSTWSMACAIERAHASLAHAHPVDGRTVMLDPDEAAKRIPELYDDLRRRRVGEISRPDGWWSDYFRDPEVFREGASARFYALHETAAGEPDGFVSYRIKKHWADDGVSRGDTQIQELHAATPAVRTALWEFCLGVDLSATVSCWNTPVDEPLRWALADPRRLRVTGVHDWLWTRLVDVAAALAARRYSAPGRLVIEVVDTFKPHNSGRYELVGGPDGAECAPTDAEADLAVGVADLGALYLGGVACTTLARAGRVRPQRAGALVTADAMFVTPEAPWSVTEF